MLVRAACWRRVYEDAEIRKDDLYQLEQIAGGYP